MLYHPAFQDWQRWQEGFYTLSHPSASLFLWDVAQHKQLQSYFQFVITALIRSTATQVARGSWVLALDKDCKQGTPVRPPRVPYTPSSPVLRQEGWRLEYRMWVPSEKRPEGSK